MRLVYKTLIPIILVLSVATFMTGVLVRQSLGDAVLNEQFLKLGDSVLSARAELLDADSFSEPFSKVSQEKFRTLAERVKDTTVVRVTIWDADHHIVYSDLSSIIGVQSPQQLNVSKALQDGRAFFIRKEVDDDYPIQSNLNDFLDIYIPLRFSGDVAAVVQIHAVAGAVLTPIANALNQVLVTTIVSSLLVLLIIIAIFSIFILRPISLAGVMARAVSEGDFQERAIPVFDDEIGALVGNLNTMRERLKSLVENLGDQVEERTRKLSEEESRLEASLGSLSAGIALADPSGEIVYSNSALASFVGAKEGQTSMHALAEYVGDACNIRRYFLECLSTRQSFNVRETAVGGRFFHLYLAPVIAKTSQADVIGVVILLDDITEARSLERAKEEFLTIASHELRTPLAAIRANASLLKQHFVIHKEGSDEAGMVDDIHDASVRLINIVHNFLEVASLEQRSTDIKAEHFDGVLAVNEVVQELQGLTKEKGLILKAKNPPTSLPHIAGDRQRYKQVITNLVGNAIHYTPQGSITLSFEHENSSVKVYVKDTGIGIASEQQSLLFKKFQQAGENILSRDVSQGTGLGLYISKLLVDLMGGTIALEESTPGKGSTFSVTMQTVAEENGPV